MLQQIDGMDAGEEGGALDADVAVHAHPASRRPAPGGDQVALARGGPGRSFSLRDLAAVRAHQGLRGDPSSRRAGARVATGLLTDAAGLPRGRWLPTNRSAIGATADALHAASARPSTGLAVEMLVAGGSRCLRSLP